MTTRGDVCGCHECVAAGVASEPVQRVPDGTTAGRVIHGSELARWLRARADFLRAAREAVGPRGRRGSFERLVVNAPQSDKTALQEDQR